MEKRYLKALQEITSYKYIHRDILTGVHFTKSGHAQATDTYIAIDIDLGVNFEKDFTIQLTDNIIDVLSDGGGSLAISDNIVTISSRTMSVQTKMIEGSYPNIDSIMTGITHGGIEKLCISTEVLSHINKLAKILKAWGVKIEMPCNYNRAFNVKFCNDNNVRLIATPIREERD